MNNNTGLFEALPSRYSINSTSQPIFRVLRIRPGSRTTLLLTLVVIGVVLLAPLPGASNQPMAWLLWAIVLGATASIVAATSPTRRTLSKLNRSLFFFALLYLGFALFQAVALPGFRGGLLVYYPNTEIRLNSLSIAPGATLLASIRITSFIIFYWLMLFVVRNTARAKQIGFVLFFGVALYGAFAIVSLKLLGDFQLMGEKTAFQGMATGPFVNRNSFATYLGMGFILGISLYPRRAERRPVNSQSIIHGLALFIILLTLVLTQSRMGLIATAIATLAVLNARTSDSRTKIFSVLAIFAAIAAMYNIGLLHRFADLPRSFATRYELYEQIVTMIIYRPLTGSGLDSFPLAYELFHQAPVTSGFVWDNAHSTYLILWSEAGLVFGTIPILCAALAARQLYRQCKVFRPGQSMALAAWACLLLAGLHSLVDFSLEIQANAFFLLALVALGFGAQNFEQENDVGI